MDGRMDGQTDRQTDRQTDGRTDGRMDGAQQRTPDRRRNIERPSLHQQVHAAALAEQENSNGRNGIARTKLHGTSRHKKQHGDT
jgi:hypothetical protein